MIKKHVVLIIAISFIIGCGDDTMESFQPGINENILKISTPQEYLDLTKKMTNISYAEFAQFEAQKGYTSLRTLLNKAYDELMTLESEEELAAFLAKHKNILVMKDDRVRPLIELSLYQHLANEQGFFETHGLLHRVTPDYLYTVEIENKHLLDDINFEEDIKSNKISVNNYTFSEQADLSSGRYSDGTCPISYFQRGVYNPSGCNSDRDLEVRVRTYHVCGYDLGGMPSCAQWTEVRGYPSRKNWYCEWYDYLTPVTFANISYKIDGVESTYTLPDTYFDTFDDYVVSGISFFTFDSPANPNRGFNYLHVEATSQGLHGKWIVMDNYCD